MKQIKFLLVLALTLTVFSCGGGGGDDDEPVQLTALPTSDNDSCEGGVQFNTQVPDEVTVDVPVDPPVDDDPVCSPDNLPCIGNPSTGNGSVKRAEALAKLQGLKLAAPSLKLDNSTIIATCGSNVTITIGGDGNNSGNTIPAQGA